MNSNDGKWTELDRQADKAARAWASENGGWPGMEADRAFRAGWIAARDTDETSLRTHIAEQIEALRSPLHTGGWNDALAEIKSRVLAEGAGS